MYVILNDIILPDAISVTYRSRLCIGAYNDRVEEVKGSPSTDHDNMLERVQLAQE